MMPTELKQVLNTVNVAWATLAEAVELERQEQALCGAEPNAKTLEAYELLRDLLDRHLPNVPIECEDRECNDCAVGNEERATVDCPYAVHDSHFIVVTTCGETLDDAGHETSNAQVIDFVEAKNAAEATETARPDGAFHREAFIAYRLADDETTSHLSWTNRKWYTDRGLTPVNWPNTEGDEDDEEDA
jgi:hypothetical protein